MMNKVLPEFPLKRKNKYRLSLRLNISNHKMNYHERRFKQKRISGQIKNQYE